MDISYRAYLFVLLNLAELLFLLKAPESRLAWGAFFSTHGAVMALLYSILVQLFLADTYLRSRFHIKLILSLLLISIIPVFGPVFLLSLAILLKIIKVRYRELYQYEIVPLEKIEKYSAFFTAKPGSVPEKDLVEFLYGKAQEFALGWLQYIKHQPWSPFKTRFLRFILSYAREPHLILEASKQIEEERKRIYKKIASLEKVSSEKKVFYELACLYHRIYELSLGDPTTNYWCLKRACYYLEKFLEKTRPDSRHLTTAGEWFLELLDLKKAENYLLEAQKFAEEYYLRSKVSYLLGVVHFLQGRL